jgi:hypothetical protein
MIVSKHTGHEPSSAEELLSSKDIPRDPRHAKLRRLKLKDALRDHTPGELQKPSKPLSVFEDQISVTVLNRYRES